jgi:Toastrack DUF4097
MWTRGRRIESKCLMILVGTYLTISAATLAAEGHFDRTLEVAGPVELTIRAGAGSVTVLPGNESSMQVRGNIRAHKGLFSGAEARKRVQYLEAHPPIEQHGNIVTIGAVTDSHLQQGTSISYELTVPVATRLSSTTGSGDQIIEGVAGPVEVQTGSGKIKASNIGGNLRASTGSGQIELASVKGKVRASTGSGIIRAMGIAGNFWASTGSGDVTLEQNGMADAHLATGSGSIELKNVLGLVQARTASGPIIVEGGGREPWHLETVSGSITVHLPADLGFDLQAHTVSGSITTKRSLTIEGKAGKRELTGKAGEGGKALDVSTVSGDIRIE